MPIYSTYSATILSSAVSGKCFFFFQHLQNLSDEPDFYQTLLPASHKTSRLHPADNMCHRLCLGNGLPLAVNVLPIAHNLLTGYVMITCLTAICKRNTWCVVIQLLLQKMVTNLHYMKTELLGMDEFCETSRWIIAIVAKITISKPYAKFRLV